MSFNSHVLSYWASIIWTRAHAWNINLCLIELNDVIWEDHSLQVFHDFYQKLPEPKRLIGYSKFASKHFASEGNACPPTIFWINLSRARWQAAIWCHAHEPQDSQLHPSLQASIDLVIGLFLAPRQQAYRTRYNLTLLGFHLFSYSVPFCTQASAAYYNISCFGMVFYLVPSIKLRFLNADHLMWQFINTWYLITA